MTTTSSSLTQNREEIDLVTLVYPDLVRVLDNGEIHVNLPSNIEVIFILPEGYPTKAPPIHKIVASTDSSNLRDKIDDQLKRNYEIYAGYQLLVTCIAEVNSIVNDTKDHNRCATPKEHAKTDESQGSEMEETIDQQPTKRFDWIGGSVIEDRKSKFQAHLVRIQSKDEAMLALAELKENNKIARATHNIYAYFVRMPNGCEQSDCEDDGEKGAGSRLMHMLKLMKVDNMMVVVTRWYGGVHLSTDRFRHICNAARELVVKYRGIDCK